MDAPPSIVRIAPVVKLAASLARYSAAPTILLGSPARCSGQVLLERFLNSSVCAQTLLTSVRNGPDMMQLTRTFGPYSCANAIVIALSPAFAAEYGAVVREGRTAAVEEILTMAPPSPAAIREPNSADNRNGPLRFTPTTLSKSSSLCSANDG